MSYPKLIFLEELDERYKFEMPLKGWTNVYIELDDGSRYSLTFYDPIRLNQTIEEELSSGATFFAETNLVIVPNVTVEGLQQAVNDLYENGFFSSLKPVNSQAE